MKDLYKLKNSLSGQKSISYFTDGSLHRRTLADNSTHYIQGAGVIVKQPDSVSDNDTLSLSVKASLSQWPSSTRAELFAIFLALLTAPTHSHVSINSDSQVAINGLSFLIARHHHN